MPPLHQIIVTGSGGPTASQDSWKGALGSTARSFGSTVKNGTPREKKEVGNEPCHLCLQLSKPQVCYHLKPSLQKIPQALMIGVTAEQAPSLKGELLFGSLRSILYAVLLGRADPPLPDLL